MLSNQASVPMERVAAAAGDGVARWFQLYWSVDDDLVASFLARAEACGCEAVVVTLDTTMLGWRPDDLDLGSLPFLQGRGIAQYTSDPGVPAAAGRAVASRHRPRVAPRSPGSARCCSRPAPTPGPRGRRCAPGGRAPPCSASPASTRAPTLTWDDVGRLRGMTSLPVVLKGVLHPDDARRAVDVGADAVWVSNHGGRQVDGAVSAVGALPEVVAAVDGRVPVLLDSGVRGGGGTWCAPWRWGPPRQSWAAPYVYGLALGGEQGVREVVANLRADVDLTFGLAGCRSVAEVRDGGLARA